MARNIKKQLKKQSGVQISETERKWLEKSAKMDEQDRLLGPAMEAMSGVQVGKNEKKWLKKKGK